MKVSPLFTAENGFLVRIADGMKIDTSSVNVVPVEKIVSGETGAPELLTAVSLPWGTVELEPGVYNEEVLASLRGYLKALEPGGNCALIIFSAGRDISDSDAAGSFIQAAVHTARRIKDCACAAGFSVAPELLRKDSGGGTAEGSWTRRFMDEMSVKHPQYVYFADSEAAGRCGLDKEALRRQFVMYSLR